ncbi:hypothetical protein TWF694_009310 [Orbilia ellipsospora]|uniref:Uncharacterized protein n=1 Tax=Orbilia ellipsospora TaxID=2528407 RepID=A0AAV9XEJ0_9PEZI
MLRRRRTNGALACKDCINDLAFVTVDQKVETLFGNGLNGQGITMFTISLQRLEWGIKTAPSKAKKS